MKKTSFNKLLQGVHEAGPYLRDNRQAASRVDRFYPGSIAAVRGKLGLCPARFAHAIGIGLDTLQNWEQGHRQPIGLANVRLKVAAKHPDAILDAVG